MNLRLTGRRDGLLLAGLAVAMITVFDRTIGRLLEIATAVEAGYGVRLLPALVVLAAIFVLHLHAKRQESRADTPLKGALHVADVLRREIALLAIRPSSTGEAVTASVGVARAVAGEIDPVYCIQRADRALYAAKHQGRNCIAAEPGEGDAARLARSA